MKGKNKLSVRFIRFLILGVSSFAIFVATLMLSACNSEQKVIEQGQKEEKKELWTCSMHPQVIQDHPGLCPICHMTLVPLKDNAPQQDRPQNGTVENDKGEKKIKYWWDPMMSPPYISKTPGKSPMGMELVPVYEDSASQSTNELRIDPAIVQNMGVRTAEATKATLSQDIDAVGYLIEAEPNVRDITLLISGWARKLYANAEGMHVEKGQPLFDLYSPELNVAVQELIGAKKLSGQTDSSTNAIYLAAKRKLELWGLSKDQIASLEREVTPPSVITFQSPTTGEVIQKNVVDGASVKAGDLIYKIVDLKTLWLNAQVFEKDLSSLKIGQSAKAVIGDSTLEGEIVFIDPRIDTETRTTRVRLQIPNPNLLFKPGMFATISIRQQSAEPVLTVPRESVIDTGKRKIIFIAQQQGTFQLREVETGRSGEPGLIEITSGLSVGDKVVTSGQFLLDSESRLREAVQKFLSERQQLTVQSNENSSLASGDAAHGGHQHD